MKSLYERALALKKGLNQPFKNASINVDNLTGGGILNPQQRRQFIDWIFQSTQLMSAVRSFTMLAPKTEMPGLIFPSRLTRGVGINTDIYGGQTQGQRDIEDQGNYLRSGITSYQIELLAKEISLSYAVNENFLQDNIEGQNLANKLANYYANQFGVDMEELGIIGEIVDRNPASPISVLTSSITAIAATRIETGAVDPRTVGFPESSTTGYLYYDHGAPNGVELMLYDGVSFSGGVWGFDNVVKGAVNEDSGVTTPDVAIASGETLGWFKHHLLGVADGWLYRVKNPNAGAPGGNLVAANLINAGVLSENHFTDMLKAMPRKYRSNPAFRRGLTWIMNEDLWLDWIRRISTRGDLGSATADAALRGIAPDPQQIPVLVSTNFPDDKILLTNPQNLISGIYKDITLKSTNQGKTALMTNQRFSNTRARIDYNIERADVTVLAEGFVAP